MTDSTTPDTEPVTQPQTQLQEFEHFMAKVMKGCPSEGPAYKAMKTVWVSAQICLLSRINHIATSDSNDVELGDSIEALQRQAADNMLHVVLDGLRTMRPNE